MAGWSVRLHSALSRHLPLLLKSRHALNRAAPHLAVGVVALYIATFTALSILKLALLRQGFDMAGNEQTIWNTLHGRPFRTSIFAFMDYDFDDGPVLLQLPLALLYGIHPAPSTLLFLQTVALGLAAWPLYLVGRELLPEPWHALALVLLYLLHPTTQHINLYEFQLRAFLLPFALGSLLFLRWEWWWPYVACLLLMIATKTEAGFTLVAFGLYALLTRRSWHFVLPPLLIGPLWVVLALGVIVPHFSRGDFIRDIYRYGVLGNSIGEVIWNLATNPLRFLHTVMSTPEKLTYVGLLFGIQGFLALLSPTTLLALPVLAMNLIAPNRVQFSLNYQYPALVYPFLLVAAAEGVMVVARGVAHLRKNRATATGTGKEDEEDEEDAPYAHGVANAGMALLVVGALVANVALNNVVLGLLRHHESAARVADARAIIAQVPPGVPLAASSFLAPHLAQREELFFFPGNQSYPRAYLARAEYLVADRHAPGMSQEERELLHDYLHRPDWEIVAQEGDFVLLRRVRYDRGEEGERQHGEEVGT
ncbi:MAG: DUF2079 domain-containing protein [Chloroflexaceae bacterium]|nr:DUF2079 domain-containing protein [Chloroflexaceae bacterium]